MALPEPELCLICSIETRIMEGVPIYCSLMCKIERARSVIPVLCMWITGKTGNGCYISWLLAVLCWPCCARWCTHIRALHWNGTEELSFWRNNSFLLNLCVDVFVGGVHLWNFDAFSPVSFSKGVLLASFLFFFFPCMVQNTLMPVNLLTI